jgi:hypothetical protein
MILILISIENLYFAADLVSPPSHLTACILTKF